MKRKLTLLLAAAMAVTAVSCGKSDSGAAPAEETATESETTSLNLDELLSEYTTTAEELEEQLAEMRVQAMEHVDMTAQPIPEYEIPADWKEISDGRLKMLVPPEVEDETSSGSLILGKFRSNDKSVAIITMEGNDWSQPADTEDEDFFPEASEENCARAFENMGIEYDGTRASYYRAMLSFTSADRTEENAVDFDTLALAKGLTFIIFPEVFHKETDGHDIYAHAYASENLLGKNSENSDSKFWVGAFADGNTEYTATVSARSREEALMICSTIEFC